MQDNVRLGNEAQLLGGYAAGWLLLSALTGLAYLGFWLRCLLLLLQLDKVSPSDHLPPATLPFLPFRRTRSALNSRTMTSLCGVVWRFIWAAVVALKCL